MKCKSCGHDNHKGARFCATCGAALSVPLAPGVGSSYKNAWRQLWKHFPVLLLILIVSQLISFVSLVFSYTVASDLLRLLFEYVYSFLISGPIGYGAVFAYLKAAREDPVKFKDMFEVLRNYWNAVLAGLFVSIIVIVGMILLIIPGIYLGCKLAFTPYLVVDRKMGVIEAIQGSFRMTSGHAWKVFLIGLLVIPIFIAGILCFGVGLIVAIMLCALALASLYHAVSSLGESSP